MADLLTPETMPTGCYCIVELYGYITLVGRLGSFNGLDGFEVIEPLFNCRLLGPVNQARRSIYRITPCTPQIAFLRHPRLLRSLPRAIRLNLPLDMLPAHSPLQTETFETVEQRDDETAHV